LLSPAQKINLTPKNLIAKNSALSRLQHVALEIEVPGSSSKVKLFISQIAKMEA
jgi:hypothetical protein